MALHCHALITHNPLLHSSYGRESPSSPLCSKESGLDSPASSFVLALIFIQPNTGPKMLKFNCKLVYKRKNAGSFSFFVNNYVKILKKKGPDGCKKNGSSHSSGCFSKQSGKLFIYLEWVTWYLKQSPRCRGSPRRRAGKSGPCCQAFVVMRRSSARKNEMSLISFVAATSKVWVTGELQTR